MSARTDAARARVNQAQARLIDTVGELRERLDPRVLTRDVFDDIAEGGQKALNAGADAARRNPGKLAAGAAVIAAFLGRHRIVGLFTGGRDERKQPARDPRVAGKEGR